MSIEKTTLPKRKLHLSPTTIRVLLVGDPAALCEGPTSKIETNTNAPPCGLNTTTYTLPTQAECKPEEPQPPPKPDQRP